MKRLLFFSMFSGAAWTYLHRFFRPDAGWSSIIFLVVQIAIVLASHLAGYEPLALVFALLALYLTSFRSDRSAGENSAARAFFAAYILVWFFAKYAATLSDYFLFVAERAAHSPDLAKLRVRCAQAFGTLARYPMIGLSFIGFKLIHFALDRKNGRIANWKISEVLAWIFFFPTILSGPIQRFQDWQEQRATLVVDPLAHFYEGTKRLIEGLFLKFVLADSIYDLTVVSLSSSEVAVMPAGSFVVYGLLYTLYLYWDFAGYSSIAIGLGHFWGMRVPENFNFPLKSRNLSEFWNRWHITLSAWLKEYLFFPLTLWMKRNPAFRKHVVLGIFLPPLLTFLIAGFWHGAALGYLIFGALHGIGLGFIALLDKKLPSKHPAVIWWRTHRVSYFAAAAFNYVYVSLSLTFFALSNESLAVLFHRVF